MDLRKGQRLGNYRLLKVLGRGGVAEVYLAEHLHLKTFTAIKLLRGRLTPQDLEKFLREAQLLARLKHPHILPVIDFGFEGTTPFFVMEYAVNGTLRDRYPRGSILSFSQIILYARQIAAALQHAHMARIIHRDIKPENMLLDDQGRLLLSDFGSATLAHRTTSLQTLDTAGTPHYMAPEQYLGKPCTASDQYALAIVVYEWLCGRRPFHGSSSLEIAKYHLVTPPPALRKWVPDLPLELEQVILRALSKDPQHRFESIVAFVTALEYASQAGKVPIEKPVLTPCSSTHHLPAVSWPLLMAVTSLLLP
ncbi:MAG TPA: serine/threonine-protein kinase [Ktedonosporobacter sp.]|nr:serine/threonine-protein kinase [Ktedonosporobacter sp.]